MTGSLELGFPKAPACSLREQAARTILRNVRSQGHAYVELREDGKKLIFFCTLCLAPCYSETVLFDHLKGSLHTTRLSAAKVTLLGPNPWPFDDGVLFFNNSVDNDKQLVISNGCDNMLGLKNDNSKLAIVKYGENLKANGNRGDDDLNRQQYDKTWDSARNQSNKSLGSCENGLNAEEMYCTLTIPGVLIGNEVCTIDARKLGYGQIAARFLEKDETTCGISRIWCEWLGNMEYDQEDEVKVPENDFAVVTFTYRVDLGRKGLLDDVKLLLTFSPTSESENDEVVGGKRKKAFSDPGDISESLWNQYDSSGEDSSVSNGSNSRLFVDRYDDQLQHPRFILNKVARRELRRQQRIAAERMCDICQQKMLPGKDVATLMNIKTGRLACSSRNVNGAFHVFHTSCLIHWILLCESEVITKELNGPKIRRRSRRRNGSKLNKARKDVAMDEIKTQIDSLFCPECQGTGIIVDGDALEKPTIPLSEIFKYKIKVSDARRGWMRSPEVLQNCSTGFHFPHQSQETFQEKVRPLKSLQFYEARDGTSSNRSQYHRVHSIP